MLLVRRAIVLAALLLASFHYFLYTASPKTDSSWRQRLSHITPYDPESELPRYIWQTWRYSPTQEEFTSKLRHAASSWTNMNPDFRHEVLTDEGAESLIASLYADVPEVVQAYEALPLPVHKADFFRYLVLLARGGVYSDIDTIALKPIVNWTNATMRPWGMVVGIESDADRSAWFARPIQFCQWTIMSKPGHPVLVDVVAAIVEETLRRKARNELRSEGMTDIMELTGPGVWTDALFRFFSPNQRASDDSWQRFKGLEYPIKTRDVVVLPVVSFSPRIDQMGVLVGGRTASHPLAFVRHDFLGELSCVHLGLFVPLMFTIAGTWKQDQLQKKP